MRQPGAFGLAVFLLVASVAPALALSPAVGGAAAPGGPATAAQVGNQEVDATEFRITVYENTSARWAFVYKVTLENESEREEFRAYAERFNTEETELYTNFRERVRSVTRQGTDATGRRMNATGFAKRAYVPDLNDNRGIVRMSFVWTNFAVQEGDVVEMGDVFQGGFYIGSDQRLVVEHGPDLRFESANPSPIIDEDSIRASDTLTWLGEREFVDERPQVRLVPPSGPTPTPAPGEPTATETPSPSPTDPGGGSTGFLPILGLGVVLLLGLGAALAYGTGALPSGDDDGGTAAADDGGDGGGAGTPGAAADDAGGAAAGAAAGATEPAVPDEELLEDDERVMQLLEENGGRMKQVNIVEETGWSKSKVSMLLSDMEEEGRISKLRVGRENIISKKGMEPDAAGSPFDDES